MEESMNFHDATLLALNFNWAESELRCLIRPVSATAKTVSVVFSEVQSLRIPATHPWGMSSSVNSWTCEKSDHGFSFNIEMQSGDAIEVLAKKMTVEAPPPTEPH
jgi:hypothetical protein